eukprot:4762557-Amphidinium_carterae.1
MGVGRHSQLRFMDVPSSYAQWALREYEEVGSDMHPQLQRFCQWQLLQEQRKVQNKPAQACFAATLQSTAAAAASAAAAST